MIVNLLNDLKNAKVREIQFRLGHHTIAKKQSEWYEVDQHTLSVSEWEDLKDICLQNNEKVVLETKGFVKGIYSTENEAWVFSFTEWKDCLKAHFSNVETKNISSQVQFPVYWDSLKGKRGLHLVTSQRAQGKSTMIREVLAESRKDSPELIAVHAQASVLSLFSHDSIIHMGSETSQWETTHPIYDGVDTIVYDMNDVTSWSKWIRFCEEGRTVIVSLSSDSVTNTLLQIQTAIMQQVGGNGSSSLWSRFCFHLNSVLNQKVVGLQEGAVHEIWVPKTEDRQALVQNFTVPHIEKLLVESSTYQSYNQSIIQALVRRRIDVKTAFALSPDPEKLDNSLKKMGL